MKKNKQQKSKAIKILDYVKAVKKADREIELSNTLGWVSKTKIHPNKKRYNRKNDKKDYLDN